jgi:hypothetical protein
MNAMLRTWREDVGGVAAIAAMGAAVWALFVQPGASARQRAADLRVQTDLIVSQVAMVQAQARTAEADLASARSLIGPAHALRPAADFNRLLAELNQAAVDTSFVLDQITPGPVERLDDVSRHKISVAGRGSYRGAITFLETLRDRFPDVTVLALSASRGQAEESMPADVSLELAWHAQPEPAGKPKR